MKTHLKFSALALGAVALVSFSAAPAQAQYQGATLEKTIAFQSGTAFEMTNDNASVFDLLWNRESLDLPGIGLRRISHSTATSDGWVRNEIDVGAKWNGLNLRKIGYDGIENSGVGTYRMHFAESAAAVQSRFQALGMKFSNKGDSDSFCETEARVQTEERGSVLTVSHIC